MERCETKKESAAGLKLADGASEQGDMLASSREASTSPVMPAGASRTPAKASRARKVFRVFLFPLQVLATPITTVVCAIVFASGGLGIGFIMGAQNWISGIYTRCGLIPTILLSVVALPSGMLSGGLSSIGCLLGGFCAGILMPWDGGKCAIEAIQACEQYIDGFYKIERHPREVANSNPLSSPAGAAINEDEAIPPPEEGTLLE